MIAIDLGSNTIRVIEYDCESKRFGKHYEKVVKTAEGLVESDTISQNATERIIAALQEAQQTIDFTAQKVYAVTTEAMRRASNTQSVLKKIQNATGVSFEIITAYNEALMTLDAVINRLDILESKELHNSFVIVDIGGGSTELTLRYKKATLTQSFPVGIVTIAEQYKTLQEIQTALPQVMTDMYNFIEECYHLHGVAQEYIATAGTPTTVASMKLGLTYSTYNPELINGTKLHIEDLDTALERLLAMESVQREILVGVGRSDLIAAGILIFKELFKIIKKEECIVIDDGLREGVALKGCKNEKKST